MRASSLLACPLWSIVVDRETIESASKLPCPTERGIRQEQFFAPRVAGFGREPEGFEHFSKHAGIYVGFDLPAPPQNFLRDFRKRCDVNSFSGRFATGDEHCLDCN